MCRLFLFLRTMKYLIVGLGNPGSDYDETRHNIGFKVLDNLITNTESKFVSGKLGETAILKHKGRTLILLKPNTYMNLSGKAVNYWMQQEKINLENVLIITDDLALPIGKIRLKAKGSDGGHNGLKNIHEILGSENYPRLRFGVGNNFQKGRQVDYVLGKWTDDELKILSEKIPYCIETIKSFVSIGIDKTMSLFNKN